MYFMIIIPLEYLYIICLTVCRKKKYIQHVWNTNQYEPKFVTDENALFLLLRM